MSLTPEQLQDAITQYLKDNPEQSPTLKQPRRLVTVPANIKPPLPELEDDNFQPLNTPQLEPTLMLVAMEEDLVQCLQHAIDVDHMKLNTPENVFIQQALRELTKVVARLDKLIHPQPQEQEIPVQQASSQYPAQPTQLIFKETQPEPEVQSEPEPDASKKEKIKHRTPRKKRIRKGRKSAS